MPLPTHPPDFAKRDALRAAELFRALNPRDESYPLALDANKAAQSAYRRSLELWETAGNADSQAETYRRRKASKEAALECARWRWKVESFARGNRYARRKVAYAKKSGTPAAQKPSPDVPLVAPGPEKAPGPVRTFREWRSLEREESLRAEESARLIEKLSAIRAGALCLPPLFPVQ